MSLEGELKVQCTVLHFRVFIWQERKPGLALAPLRPQNSLRMRLTFIFTAPIIGMLQNPTCLARTEGHTTGPCTELILQTYTPHTHTHTHQ